MAAPAVGHKGYLQVGKESPYGTVSAATVKYPVLSCDIKLEAPPIPDQLLHGNPWGRTVVQGTKRTMGRISTHLTFDGFLELFRGAFGAYTNSLFETGVRDHTFKVGPTLNGFTTEEIIGDVPTTKCFRSSGQKINKLTLRGTAGQGVESIVTAECELIGQDRTTDQTPTGGQVFPAYFPVMFNPNMTNVDDGTGDAAADVRVRSFEFVLDNMLTDDRWHGKSATIDEPLRGDKIKCTFKFQQEFQTKTQFDAYRALTLGSPKLLFHHPTLIGATAKREFEIFADQAYLEADPTPPLDGPGVLIATSTWVAMYDGVAAVASPVVARFRTNEVALA